jgi:hypothetical protein
VAFETPAARATSSIVTRVRGTAAASDREAEARRVGMWRNVAQF